MYGERGARGSVETDEPNEAVERLEAPMRVRLDAWRRAGMVVEAA